MADFGNKSSYGHDVLDIVDATAARKLIAAGKPVYVVNGEDAVDVRHRYQTSAKSPDKKVKRAEKDDFVERKFEYGLTRIDSPDDLAAVQDGKGVPEGMVGVYKNSGKLSQMVYTKTQAGESRLDGEQVTNSHEADEAIHDGDVQRADDLQHKDLRVREKWGFGPIGGLIGATVGMMVGMAVLPHTLALLALGAGAVGGYKGTEILVDRSMVRGQEKFQERQAARQREYDELSARIEREYATRTAEAQPQ